MKEKNLFNQMYELSKVMDKDQLPEMNSCNKFVTDLVSKMGKEKSIAYVTSTFLHLFFNITNSSQEEKKKIFYEQGFSEEYNKYIDSDQLYNSSMYREVPLLEICKTIESPIVRCT